MDHAVGWRVDRVVWVDGRSGLFNKTRQSAAKRYLYVCSALSLALVGFSIGWNVN